MNKKTCIILATLLCASCNNNKNSNNFSSSTTSQDPASKILTQEILAEYAKGYKAEVIVKTGTDSLGYSYNYNNVSATNDLYQCTTYESTKNENCTKNNITCEINYAPFKVNFVNMLSEVELSFANKLAYFPVVDSSNSYISWSDAGYGNSFSSLALTDFELNEDETYSLKISKPLTTFCNSFATQLTSSMGYEIESFDLSVNNYALDTFTIKLRDIQSNYGTIKGEIKGKFLASGKEAADYIKPVEGQEDEDFMMMMEALKKQNYHLDVSLASRKYQADVENGESILYDIYSLDGKKTDSYGYYQVNSNAVRGIVRIKDKVYVDGSLLSGSLSSLLPSFNVSSVFFDKTVDGNKKIYTLKENIPCKIYANDYGVFNSSDVGDMTFTIENNTLKIENKMRLSSEVLEYTALNGIKGNLTNLKENCNELKWSDLISNQVKESASLYKTITQEELDNLPIIGGEYSHISLDASYNPKRPVFVFYADDFDIANGIRDIYVEKLVGAGFTLNENSTIKDALLYQKEITTSEGKVTLCAELLVSYQFFKTLQFLIYPYVIK